MAGPGSVAIVPRHLLAGGNDDRCRLSPRCCGPWAFACPKCRLPGLIQRLVLAGQRAAFALRPLPRALSIGLLTAFLPCGWLYLFAF